MIQFEFVNKSSWETSNWSWSCTTGVFCCCCCCFFFQFFSIYFHLFLFYCISKTIYSLMSASFNLFWFGWSKCYSMFDCSKTKKREFNFNYFNSIEFGMTKMRIWIGLKLMLGYLQKGFFFFFFKNEKCLVFFVVFKIIPKWKQFRLLSQKRFRTAMHLRRVGFFEQRVTWWTPCRYILHTLSSQF